MVLYSGPVPCLQLAQAVSSPIEKGPATRVTLRRLGSSGFESDVRLRGLRFRVQGLGFEVIFWGLGCFGLP